jgi:predicted DNA-binding transcriptional regulator AlpA
MRNFSDKIIITMPELMEQMDISDKTIHRMIEEGDLPDFSYGSKNSQNYFTLIFTVRLFLS